ncbi:hypothetical protein ABZS95_31755 [Streptomyces sp. NPDC005479]|uniref:alpha/beta fold hydrolase n=1 Tax=unclassified Streptomyces TaxID=2593676 RepID=UPI0033AEE955
MAIPVRASIGVRSVVLYDARVGVGARLDALFLVMKGECLPDGTRWRGIPAAPRHDCERSRLMHAEPTAPVLTFDSPSCAQLVLCLWWSLSDTGRFFAVTLMETQGLVPMTDGARLRWMALGDTTRRPAVILLHGGPGLPDYLGDVAPMIADLAPVYRYDQRGTGRSPWRGPHSFARHVDDLAELLDA